jgi:hypothetical protein
LGVSKTIGYSESFKGTEEAGLTVAKNAKKVTPKSASKLHANGQSRSLFMSLGTGMQIASIHLQHY